MDPSPEQSPSPESTQPLTEHEHADVTGGWLRPAVFGAMDGLVSNAALIAGVAGGTRAYTEPTVVVLAGLAGLAAGAFSMAAGEYVSVASQSEHAEAEVAKERREIQENPVDETAELAAMLAEKGIEPEIAQQAATQVHRDLDNAVTVHSMEEFGIDPGDLASPTVAAASSFVAFALGALVPVLPYLLGARSLAPAMVLALVALFACGALVTRMTSRPWWYGGMRQVLLGGAAFALTYGVGMAVGAGLA